MAVMTTISEGNQEFTFPPGWDVVKHDASTHHVQRSANWCFCIEGRPRGGAGKIWIGPIGQAGVDFIAWDGGASAFMFIEVKDYRVGSAGLPSELPDLLARKVRDSLATLAIASSDRASDLHLSGRRLLGAATLRVYLDVEIPPTMLQPPATVIANLQQQVARLMRRGPQVLVVGPGIAVRWSKRDLP